MSKIRMPKIGDNINQALTVAVKDINKALPSLQVNSDLGGTSVVHTPNGSVLHKKDISLYPNVNLTIPGRPMHGVGFWNMSSPYELYPFISANLTPERQQEFLEQIENYINFLNKLGLPPEQSRMFENVMLISKSPYLSASFIDVGEEIVPGLSGAEGRTPLTIDWSGPTVFDNMTSISVVAPGLSASVASTMIYGPADSRLSATPIACEWHFDIGTTFTGGDGVELSIHEPLSANPATPYYINAYHQNGRGLAFYPGQKTIGNVTYNTTYCSGLFWGDKQYIPPTGTSYFYNVYKSINSRQIYPKMEDPQNPGQWIDDTSQSQVIFNLYDITPCLSCGQNNSLVQNIEPIYNADSTGVRSPTLGINRLITQLDLQPVYKEALNVITGRPSTGDYVLSSHNGTMSWQVNSGGGPGPGPTPTTDEVYITEQDEITAAFNTTYNVIQMHDLSATQPDSYGCSQDHVYKHFIWSPSYGSGNYVLTTTLTTRDGQKWYGGTYNGTWHEYTSDGVGAIIKIPPATTNCKITINTFEYGDCVLSCINGSRIIFADTSDQITSFFHLGRGTQFVMVWDTYMNNWQGFLNA